MTVAQLKQLCKEHGLKVSGKKADLISRLENNTPKEEEIISLDSDEEEIFEAEEEILEVEEFVDEVDDIEEEEVLEAEVFEAEVIEDEPMSITSKAERPPGLLSQLQQPKVIAVLIVLLLAGGGYWWYVNAQLEPFTPEPLNHGDAMTYTIESGEFIATEEFVEPVLKQFNIEDDVCKLRMVFAGTGEVSVTDGGTTHQLSDDDPEGAVAIRGGLGMRWLAVERVSTHDLDDLSIHPHLRSDVPGSTSCNDWSDSAGGQMSITTTSWQEYRSRDALATKAEWAATIRGDTHEGTTMTYGLGGLFSMLEKLAPGVLMITQPIEVHEMMGTTLVQTGANGTHNGWSWRVTGPDSVAGEEMWRIKAENTLISQELCLGHASMTLWVEEGTPWAVRQEVDIHITLENQGNQCESSWDFVKDLANKEGELDLRMTMQRSGVERGEEQIGRARDYTDRPSQSSGKPSASQLSDWGSSATHVPDNSTVRPHTLEDAVACLAHIEEGGGARAALADDGYIWRAIDEQVLSFKRWNLSWVGTDDSSGWVKLDVSGEPNEDNCEYHSQGYHEDSPKWDRDKIPEMMTLAAMEAHLGESGVYPDLHGDNSLYASEGIMHQNVRFGHLVATASGSVADWISDLDRGDAAAATVDLSRSWDNAGWDYTMNLAADATDGRLIGWNLYRTPTSSSE